MSIQPATMPVMDYEQSLIDPRQAILDTLCLMSIVLWLVAQPIQFEGTEGSKTILLGLITAAFIPILWIRRREIAWGHPLIWLMIANLLWSGLVTVLALHPATSFWGSVYRSQGWLTLLTGTLLFLSATLLSPTARNHLPLVVCFVGFLLALWAWISYLGLDPTIPQMLRPAASAGNTNFLSNALVICTLMSCVVMRMGTRLRLYGIGSALFSLSALLITASRAGLLSLLVSGFLIVIIIVTIRQWKLIGKILLIGILAFSTFIAGLLFQRISFISPLPSANNTTRLLLFDDPIRLAWLDDGVISVQKLSEPLIDANGAADQWSWLRPVIGYGLDQLERINPRFELSAHYNGTWTDRLHNQILDTWLSSGLVGMLLQFGTYMTALWIGLNQLGLLSSGHDTEWWALSLLTGALTSVALLIVTKSPYGLLPWALTGGALIGLIIWLLIKLQCSRPKCLSHSNATQSMLLIALVIQGLVFNQFHFTHTMGQISWWLILGLFVVSKRSNSTVASPAYQSYLWVLPATALFFNMGLSWSKEQTLPIITIPTLLIVIVIFSLVIGWFVSKAAAMIPDIRTMSLIGIWILILSVLHLVTLYGMRQGWSPTLLVILPGLGNPLWVVLILIFSVRNLHWKRTDLRMIWMIVGILAMSLIYAPLWNGSVLHRWANSDATHNDPNTGQLYEMAERIHPVPDRIRLSQMYWKLNAGDPTEAEAHLAALLKTDPFMIGAPDVARFLRLLQKSEP